MKEAEAKEELGLVPDAREVFRGKTLKSFGTWVSDRQEMKQTIRDAEKRIGYLDKLISEILTDNNCRSCTHGSLRVTLAQGSHSTLSKERLLEKGVAASVIAECTTRRDYTYLLITDNDR